MISYTPPLMPVDIDIAHVARLARLDLSAEELEGYKTQLSAILDHAALVQRLEGDPQSESAHPLGLVNVFRDDELRESLDREEVLAQAPDSEDGYFIVPPAMESE